MIVHLKTTWGADYASLTRDIRDTEKTYNNTYLQYFYHHHSDCEVSLKLQYLQTYNTEKIQGYIFIICKIIFVTFIITPHRKNIFICFVVSMLMSYKSVR
jgi:hypothetical protein